MNSRVKRSPARTPVFWGKAAPGVAVSVSSGSGLDLGKLSAKSAQDRGGSLICTSKSENSAALTMGTGSRKSSPHCQRCANVGRFGVALLLCGFATGCDKTHWHGCAQHSMSDGKWDCSWRLLNAL